MKKLVIVIFAVVLCAGLSLTAYAQNERYEVSQPAQPAVGVAQYGEDPGVPATTFSVTLEAPVGFIDEEAPVPSLADGQAGTGEIADIAAYWAKNGWPDNISFAYLAGGETLLHDPGADGLPNAVTWWEIGIVNADEAARQEILALMSPECRVTFWDCTWSYKQREAAFNEIYASRNDIVRDAVMALNSEVVVVEIADGYEKEYAKRFSDQYGAFVVVTNEIPVLGEAIGSPADGMALEMGRDCMGGTVNNPFGAWFWAVCLMLIAGAALLVFQNRARLIPALQTANGNVITGGARISRRQAEAAVKDSAFSPPGDAFKSIMERVDDSRE